MTIAGGGLGPEGPEIGPEIALSTLKRRAIANGQRREWPPFRLLAGAEMLKRDFPAATLRSLTAVYNCWGLAFASRRTWVDLDQVRTILDDDGYAKVDKERDVRPGDVAVYLRPDDEYEHVAIVLHVEPDVERASFRFLVISKWGVNGEYIHDLRHIPMTGGVATRIEFFSERRTLA